MILQALYELAEYEGLVQDPDFEFKPIAWLVHIGKGGKFLGIQGTHYTPPAEDKKKPRPTPKSFAVPREGGRTSGDRAFLLNDKAEYSFGMDPEKDENKKRSPEKLAIRFGLFRERIKQCLEATQDEGIQAVYSFLESVAASQQSVQLPEDCVGNDLFGFVYSPDGNTLVSQREKVRAYWEAQRSTSADTTKTVQCLVSGQQSIPADLFPVIKKVPGGTSSGVALVSFNANAFESYGWKSNENAPISRRASEACATALNRLLHSAYPDPQDPNTTLKKRNLRLSSNTVLCYWSANEDDSDITDFFEGLFEANPDQVRELYHSIWRGKATDIEDPSAFYALTLTGTQGRAIVRDWFESTVAHVCQNLAAYFNDIDITRNTPKPKDRDLPPQLPLHVLLESLAPLGKRDDIPAHLTGQLVTAALSGRPFPYSILQRALERMRAEIGKKSWKDLERRDARAALIKAVLNRRKDSSSPPYQEILPIMDPNNHNPGYLLGRLMAVIENMQELALGRVNASVVDRFFGGASATPITVFPRLLKNYRNHVRKARSEDSKRGLLRNLEDQIDDIMQHIRPSWREDNYATYGTSFPRHLDLNDQGFFVIGYHHQRKWLFTSKADREATQSSD